MKFGKFFHRLFVVTLLVFDFQRGSAGKLSEETLIEPEPKVSGLLRRAKRFGCWHSCIGDPKHIAKKEECQDGDGCRCIVDLLGKIHGMSCDSTGRDPLSSSDKEVEPNDDNSNPQAKEEKKLQCNYKTCWSMEASPRSQSQNLNPDIIKKVAFVIKGVYMENKCNCGEMKKVTFTDVRPAALNHVHQKENYKFAMSHQTFPNEDGQCICKFGKSISPPVPGGGHKEAGHEDFGYSMETDGVKHTEMDHFDNDESRDIVQCGLNGCHHVVIKIPKVSNRDKTTQSPHTLNKNDSQGGTNGKKPWYVLELLRSKVRPPHPHSTATSVVCNLKTCWRVEDTNDKPLKETIDNNEGQSTDTDPVRESIQLSSVQTRRMLQQKGQGKSSRHGSQSQVYCVHGICSWVVEKDKAEIKSRSSSLHNPKQPTTKNKDDDIVPGRDGLCPCHRAYLTYYNWKHK